LQKSKIFGAYFPRILVGIELALLISEEGLHYSIFHLQKNTSIFEKMINEFAKLDKWDKEGITTRHV